MKKILLLIALIIQHITQAQNLVPNPRFEEINFCPSTLIEIRACKDWLNFGNSPDYFNACAKDGINVPNCEFGFQYAHAGGDAYAGLTTYENPIEPAGPNYREFIGVKLINSLEIGKKYYVSFFTNFSYGPSVALATNKIGLRFSTIHYDSCCPPPINNWAHVYTDSIFSDSIKWHRISGSIIADSAYSYLGIGNFFDDNHTDTLHVKSKAYPAYSYYYIDDVCVTTDSLYNEIWTVITELKNYNNHIIIYPNPTDGKLNIKSSLPIKSIQIISLLGQTIFQSGEFDKLEFKLSLAYLKTGFYCVKINTLKEQSNSLINIINNH